MIADAAHVRAIGNLPDSLGETQITPHIRQAARRLKRWVGEIAYTAAAADALAKGYDFTATSESTTDLADAEAWLALSSGVVAWNTVMENAGDNAAGIATGGKLGEDNYTYLTPGQVEKMRTMYIAEAEQAANDYLTDAPGSPGPSQSYAYDADNQPIDD